MKDFFSSVRFKILAGVAIVLAAFMLRAAWTGGFGTLTSSMLGAITAPLQKVSATISGGVGNFLDGLVSAGELHEENEQLREEIRALNEKIVDYDAMKHQNEVYSELWNIRDQYQGIEFEPAQVIGNDSSDRFYSFTIDKGSLDDIDLRDSVHTPAGFVGVVTEVGLTYSKVSTILDPAVNISVYDTRTRDTGIVSGTVELAADGRCKLSYLPRESTAAAGDLVATSGVSGRYPKDQIVGRITEVHAESHGNSLYAIIEPTTDIHAVKDVIVVKSFVGQGDSSVPPAQNGNAAGDKSASSESASASSAAGTPSSEASAPASSAVSTPSSSEASAPASSAVSTPSSSEASASASSAAGTPSSSEASASASSAAGTPSSEVSAPASSAAGTPSSSEASAPESSAVSTPASEESAPVSSTVSTPEQEVLPEEEPGDEE